MNTNTTENTRNNIIPHDSTSRGYSVRNSFYDSPYNMDFEYGYLNLIVNISSFTARTQDMFLNLESNLSNIIELQNERRRHDIEARETNENSNISQPTSQPTSQPASSHPTTSSTTNTPAPPPPLPNSNLNSIFGTRNVFLGLNPNTLYNNNNTSNLGQTTNRGIRRNRDGLTIQEIEENTEIVNYDSIDADQILNTECPISRDVFNSTSIVLRLKECRHCFVPFRIMTWLESHSTCPLCRCVVAPAAAAAAPTTPTTTFSNILNNIRNNSNLDNLSIDNINDDSFVFSFDMPRPTINAAQGQDVTNAYLSTLSQLFSNTNNTRARQNNETTDSAANTAANTTANTASNESNNIYEEVD